MRLRSLAYLALAVIVLLTGAAATAHGRLQKIAKPPAKAQRPAPDPGPATRGSVRVLSFNACGAVCHRGEVPRTAAYIARTALAHRSAVVFLQELCHGQFVKIRALTRDRGYRAFFAAQTTARRCTAGGHDGSFGVAMLIRAEAWGRVVRKLPATPGYERRVLLGARARLAGRTTFVAVVHTSPTRRAGLPSQLNAVANYLRPLAATPAIVGGDFNAVPDTPGLGAILSRTAGGTGRFIELDQLRRRPTFEPANRKIDYIFASEAHFTTPTASSRPTRMSDHHIYAGNFQVL